MRRQYKNTLPPVFAHVLTACVVLCLLACSRPDFEAIANYKQFLEKAKPSLSKMNQAREDLFQLGDPDEMTPKFKDELLPQIQQLSDLAKGQPEPEVERLARIHAKLKGVLIAYSEATAALVDRLEAIATNGKLGDGDRAQRLERTLLRWGEADQRFGKDMADLVNELSKYLDDQASR